MNNDIEVLLQRVSRLERQNKLMKLAGVAAILGIAVILFSGATISKSPKVIQARALEVVDENGKPCATLGFMDGNPALFFWDKNGHNRATLGLVNEEPSLVLFDENKKPRASLSLLNGDSELCFLMKTENYALLWDL